MISLFSLLFLHIKSDRITHNCYSTSINLDTFQDKSIDYEISCFQDEIQRINIANANNLNSISVYDNSNIIISCSHINKCNDINLFFYDNPNITFENNCCFKTIEIHSSPTFTLLKNSNVSIDTTIIYNQTYQFPLNSQKIIYYPNSPKDLLESNYSNSTINEHYCYNELNVGIEYSYSLFQCGSESPILIYYSDFQKHRFYVYENITITSLPIEKYIESTISNISQIISPQKRIEIIIKDRNYFDYYLDAAKLIRKYFDNKEIGIYFVKLFRGRLYQCPWDKYIYEPGDWVPKIEKNGWRKLCINNSRYLFYQEEQAKLIIIPTNASLIIIFSIIGSIILFFISFAIIAYIRFRKENIPNINEKP